MKLGILVLRVVVGGTIAAHGLQKLVGAWEGPGLDGTEKMMGALGMKPERANARAVALAETAGGIGLALGAATPASAAAVVGAMATAVRTVHLENGFFNTNRGYEFNAVLSAAAVAIVADGPGPVSIDAAFGHKKWGTVLALGSLVGGIAASSVVIANAQRLRAAERDADAASPADLMASATTADAEDGAVGAEGSASA